MSITTHPREGDGRLFVSVENPARHGIGPTEGRDRVPLPVNPTIEF